MKTGLVLEGGAMRGMFTAGVLDVMMEHQLTVDGIIGVSAGAAFGCNYKSKQIGRTIRYNKKYCADPRYCGWGSLFKTGNFYNVSFAYEEIPNQLDLFDMETFEKNPTEFYVVATDVHTGKPVYRRLFHGDREDLLWMRASASMPLLSKIVEIDGGGYLDGGTSDSIPLRYFEGIGYQKNLVITTQPKGFVKEPNRFLPIMKVVYRKYPLLIETVAKRHEMYNEQLLYLEEAEKAGRIMVIRPPEPLQVKAGEKNAEELERVYQIGRQEGVKHLDAITTFLQK